MDRIRSAGLSLVLVVVLSAWPWQGSLADPVASGDTVSRSIARDVALRTDVRQSMAQVNTGLLQKLARWEGADNSTQAAIFAELIGHLQVRRARLLELIEQDPTEAAAHLMPATLREAPAASGSGSHRAPRQSVRSRVGAYRRRS